MPLEKALGHHFKNKELLSQALTHASSKQRSTVSISYERLEFLGDRILGLVVAEMLYQAFPDESEGALAKRHGLLVSQTVLEKIADTLEIKSAIHAMGRETTLLLTGSILADMVESLIAALYLDAGFETARVFIMKQWQNYLIQDLKPPEDGKSALQEWTQSRGLPLPAYKIVNREGPDHQPVFTVEVSVTGHPPQQATGASKQLAEKLAAMKLITIVREQNNE